MSFFENTRKPQGFGGKLMTKMMNIGHSRLSQWGFSNISVNPDAEVLDVGCGGGANIAVWLEQMQEGPCDRIGLIRRLVWQNLKN
mgnify:CR=1 FL=1